MAEDEASPMSASRANVIADDLYFGTAEKTVSRSSQVADSYLAPYNPDDVYQRTGDYSIYELLRIDDQAAVAMTLKIDMVIGAGWDIVVEKEGDTEIRDDIFQRLEEDVSVTFDDQLAELIDNQYSYGFALSEKLFKLREDNTLSFDELRTRHPNSWLMHTDKHGRVDKYEQRGADGDLDVNPKSLIHAINNRMWQNPYGRSDLRVAYEAWMTKRHIVRFYAIFLEKHASPTPVARYDKKAPRDKVTDIFNIIKRFQAKTAMVIPKEFEVEFLESKSNGEAYAKAIDLFNMFIGRALTIPDLLGFSGSGSQSGGSQALGREQMNIFFKHIGRRRRSLERLVNKHIVQPMVVWNFGNVELFPKFTLRPLSEEDAIQYAKTFLDAIRVKAYKPSEDEINHFRSLIKFPEGDVEFQEPAPSPFGGGFNAPEDPELDPEKPPVEDEDLPDEEEEDLKKKNFQQGQGLKETTSDRKLNKKAIKSVLEGNHQKLLAEIQPITDVIFEDLFKQIERKKILEGKGKPERIKDLKLKKLSQIKASLDRNLKAHHKDMQILARQELPKKNFAEPLPTDEFLEFLEIEDFDYVGQWEFNIDERTARELKNAIKEGLPLSAVREVLKNDLTQLSDVGLERYSRTKHTEVMNWARRSEFEASGVVHGYQYSAILDGRTTAICAGLHGKKFRAGTEPIPPLHFNCRSLLIPINVFQEFDPDDKIPVGKKNIRIDRFIDQNIGKGFPQVNSQELKKAVKPKE